MVFAVALWPSRRENAGAFHGSGKGTTSEHGEAFHSLAFPRLALGNNESAHYRFGCEVEKDSFRPGRGGCAPGPSGKAYKRSQGARGSGPGPLGVAKEADRIDRTRGDFPFPKLKKPAFCVPVVPAALKLQPLPKGF